MTVRKPGPLSVIQYWNYLVLRFSIRKRILILEIGKHFSPHFSFTLRKLKNAKNRQFQFKNSFVCNCVKEGGPKGSKENRSNYFRDRPPGLKTLHKCEQSLIKTLVVFPLSLKPSKGTLKGIYAVRLNILTFIKYRGFIYAVNTHKRPFRGVF